MAEIKGRKQPLGFMSEEHKRKISEAQKGRSLTAEHRAKLRGKRPHAKPWNKGRRYSLRHHAQFFKGQPAWNKGKPLSEETKQKLRDAMKGRFVGSKGPGYIDGRTPIYQIIRHSLEYRLWRDAVFARDKYRCIWCGDARGGNLEADHIKPFAYFPELRFAIDNGRTLCHGCHKTTDTYGRKATHH
jgi:hypothetical protein